MWAHILLGTPHLPTLLIYWLMMNPLRTFHSSCRDAESASTFLWSVGAPFLLGKTFFHLNSTLLSGDPSLWIPSDHSLFSLHSHYNASLRGKCQGCLGFRGSKRAKKCTPKLISQVKSLKIVDSDRFKLQEVGNLELDLLLR